MIHIDGLQHLPIQSLGMGVFDGLHLGHQHLSKNVDALLTFSPHPVVCLQKNKDLKMLTTPSELAQFVPKLFVLKFTRDIASLTPDAFLNDIVLAHLKPQKIVVGYDYTFGKNKAGTVGFLKEWGAHMGILVESIDPYCFDDGIPVKSSIIRKSLGHDFNKAIQLLGHSYLVEGTVVAGEGRGKQLGFPTANLLLPSDKLLPGKGVYSGSVTLDEKPYRAMIYIGDHPTFATSDTHMEVHILNFEGNLYGRSLSVFMDQKIRGEMKFPSQEALITQINQDIQAAFQSPND